ncbi:MAG: sn-glycerol-3-phosphate ABC transporter ATP-binding protein UgpC [Hyphomonas sp.]|nr:sn-glycerol-3-phosphate ABC transporter ATP-binding protein UgpC [Hyphomonas sp.]
MANIELKSVAKRFGPLQVLHGISIFIENGEFLVLVGPSGCGKSTLLRMVAGLEDISGGRIEINGKVVNHLAPKERDIAMVFQNYALYPHMTVAQNLGFSLKLSGMRAQELTSKVERTAESLGLEQLLERYPKQLSGGQRQRVAMGRAIVRDPQVFLFDEPLSNLDAKLRVQMRAEIKQMHHKLGATMVYVTHDQVEAMTMADRIVVMCDGKIEQVGTPLDLYDTPANMFVASFIGSPSMNFFKGRIGDGGFQLQNGSVLPVNGSQPETAVHYGVRPEHMMLAPSSGVEATVTVIEPTGAETMVVSECNGQTVHSVVRDRLDLVAGDTIRLAPDPSSIHLFDESGQRLN